MPELPEVETVRRQLAREIEGETIKNVVVRFGRRLFPSVVSFVRRVKGRKIVAVKRRAKLIVVKLSGEMNILIHLKMTGRLLLRHAGTEPTKHTHLILKLSGNKEIHWEDWRKFGFVKVLSDNEVERHLSAQSYGPEPLGRGFTAEKMAVCLRAYPKKKIKPLLLEQTCIAGIGNIYAAESLWSAKLYPEMRVGKITDAQMRTLHRGLVSILRRSIAARGTSSDAYLDVYGHRGTYVPKLNVYGRDGKPCKRCRTILKKVVISGRSTVYCPKCQM